MITSGWAFTIWNSGFHILQNVFELGVLPTIMQGFDLGLTTPGSAELWE
jgi:hypothetical protein